MPKHLALASLLLGGFPTPFQECVPSLPRGTGARVETVREFTARFVGGSGAVEYTLRVVRHDVVRLYVREDGSLRRRVIASFVSREQYRPSGDGTPPALSVIAIRAPGERGFPDPTAINAADFVQRGREFTTHDDRAMPIDAAKRLNDALIPEDRLLALLPEKIAANAQWSPSVEALDGFFAARQLLPADLALALRTALGKLGATAKAAAPSRLTLGSGGDALKGSIELHATGAPLSVDAALTASFPFNTRTVQYETRLTAALRASVTWGAMSEARIGRLPEADWFVRTPTVADYQSMADDGGKKYLQALLLARDGDRARAEEAYRIYRSLLARDRSLTPTAAFADLDLWFARLSHRLGYVDSAVFAYNLAAGAGSLLDTSRVPLDRAEARLLLGAAAADDVLADIAAVNGRGEGGRVDYLTGRALAAKGDWKGAAQRFEAAATAAVSDAPLRKLWLAIAQRELGDTPAALQSARAALNLSPTFRAAKRFSEECAASVPRQLDVIASSEEFVPLGTYHLRAREPGDRPLPPLVGLRFFNLGSAAVPLKILMSVKDVADDIVRDVSIPAGKAWTVLALTPELKSAVRIEKAESEIRATAVLIVRRADTGQAVFQADLPLRFRPRHEAAWRTTDPDIEGPVVDRTPSIAAWVTPDAKFVAAWLLDASMPLSPASRPRVRALFNLFRKRVRVVGENEIGADGTTSVINLRLPSRVAATGEATPFEAVLFFASLLEAAGHPPFVINASGRFLVGWRADDSEDAGHTEITIDLQVVEGRTFEEAIGVGVAAFQSRLHAARRGAQEGEFWTLDIASLRKTGYRAQPAADEPGDK